MMTLQQFSSRPESIPTTTSWYLADLGEARGKQELFTKQLPQRLKVLREHALIESAVSSNRIEGVVIDQARVATVVLGKSLLRDRDEEEVRGYRDALKLIHEQGTKLPVSEATTKRLHRQIRGEIWDAGKYKEKDSDIIEKYPDGRERVRFTAVAATETGAYMRRLVEAWRHCLRERWVHPVVALAAFNLDFLCIHPFRDGNGRVSRLLLLLQCYHLGYEVGRYISLERLIEQNKDRYYETLEQSSQGWHEG
ncbi:MAG: cell filamentation protein Fic, partial [Deltaproteobacteria bacterium RIFCSPHIGHO2_02_FULL_60_17]